MKRFFLNLLCVFLLAFGLAGCNSQIDNVKNSILDFDKSTTIGKAFDNYSYFKKTSWSEFETKNGQVIVEFEGIMDFDKFYTDHHSEYGSSRYKKAENRELVSNSKISMIVQFKINKDDTFKIIYLGTKYNDRRLSARIDNIRHIYSDKPMPFWEFDLFDYLRLK